jgi:hypothetical protein
MGGTFYALIFHFQLWHPDYPSDVVGEEHQQGQKAKISAKSKTILFFT